MMEIDRYEVWGDSGGEVREAKKANGEWVLFIDHAAALATLNAEVERLSEYKALLDEIYTAACCSSATVIEIKSDVFMNDYNAIAAKERDDE